MVVFDKLQSAWIYVTYIPGSVRWEVQRFLQKYTCLPIYVIRPFRSYERWKHVREFPIGSIVEDCSYHPGVIQSVDLDGDVVIKSLLNGKEANCSLFHCGIVKLTPEQVEDRKVAWTTGGERGLMRLVGWGEDDINEFGKVWRSDDPAF